MLRKLFYASASILMLALAYHLGATTAVAQRAGPIEVKIVGVGSTAFILAEPLKVNVSNDPLTVSCPDCKP